MTPIFIFRKTYKNLQKRVNDELKNCLVRLCKEIMYQLVQI